jgi:glycosyl transferase family 8
VSTSRLTAPTPPIPGQVGTTAICFMCAIPRAETRGEAIARGFRFIASQLPLLRRSLKARWSPARRMGFSAGLRACVQSIRRLHDHVPPILLLTPASQCVTLADVDEVIPFDPHAYQSIPCDGLYFGREVFYKLELFRLRGYERIIYLDCDTIVRGDISSLWDPRQYTEREFWAVREQAVPGVTSSAFDEFNTGVMMLNRPLLQESVYRRLFEIARSGVSYDGADQGVISAYLAERGEGVAGDLDRAYNVFVSAKKLGQWDVVKDAVKVLHFVNALKPWAADHHHDWLFDEEFKRWWDEAYRFVPSPSLGEVRHRSTPVSAV